MWTPGGAGGFQLEQEDSSEAGGFLWSRRILQKSLFKAFLGHFSILVAQEDSSGAVGFQWSKRIPVEQEDSSGAGGFQWSRRIPVEQEDSS
jgi:hypothetical protein